LGTLEDRFVSSTKEKEDEKMEVDAHGEREGEARDLTSVHEI
jgi:hypothetical protein